MGIRVRCIEWRYFQWPWLTLTTPNHSNFTSWHGTKTAEQIEFFFIGTEASLGLSYTVLERNSGISKIIDTSL